MGENTETDRRQKGQNFTKVRNKGMRTYVVLDGVGMFIPTKTRYIDRKKGGKGPEVWTARLRYPATGKQKGGSGKRDLSFAHLDHKQRKRPTDRGGETRPVIRSSASL